MGTLAKTCWIGAGLATLSGALPLAAGLAIAGVVCSKRETEQDEALEKQFAELHSEQNAVLVDAARRNRRPSDAGIEIERVVEDVGPWGIRRERVVDRQRYYFDEERIR